MIKVLNLGKAKRKPSYYALVCPHCESKLVCELEDIWMDDPQNDIGRVACPVCRTKFNFEITVDKGKSFDQHPFWSDIHAKEVDEGTYNNAYIDTSKSGIAALMNEKKEKIKADIYRQLEENRELEAEAKADREKEVEDAANK